MLRIGIDAMGGDFAPDAVVMGAIEALEAIAPESRIVLFGDKEAIDAILTREGCTDERIEIVPTTEVITMNDHPAKAYAQKADSSIKVGFNYLKAGKIDGFASAGSTGAMMVGAFYAAEVIDGVIRPAISAPVATAIGTQSLLLDVGLNADCRPDVLDQYGLLGSVYAKYVWGIENPRVGLLNIGSESEKGNLTTKAAHELMAGTTHYNFVGNVEGYDLFSGKKADVIVCDGFIGNILLKASESLYPITAAHGIKNDFFSALNYEEVGGTPVLGIGRVVIIGHGCSSPKAIKNMILKTEMSAKAGYVEKLTEAFAAL